MKPPDPEEILKEVMPGTIGQNHVYITDKAKLLESYKAYGSRLLDLAAEDATVSYKGNLMADPSTSTKLFHPDGSEFSVDKQSILKIKDKL